MKYSRFVSVTKKAELSDIHKYSICNLQFQLPRESGKKMAINMMTGCRCICLGYNVFTNITDFLRASGVKPAAARWTFG